MSTKEEKEKLEEAKAEAKWTKIINKFMDDSSKSEYISPPGLAPKDRKFIHSIAEKLDICSDSKGEGRHRVVIVRKEKRQKHADDFISTTNQKKFRDDFDIKINLCDPQDFMYYIDLYDSKYKTKEKLQFMLQALKEHGGESGFAEYYDQLKEAVAGKIKSQQGFQKYIESNMQVFQLPPEHSHLLTKEGSYLDQKSGKFFISVDLRSANFNSLKYFDPNLVLGMQSWDELISQFTTTEYFKKSKMFRQRIFWLLEPTKINRISEYLIYRVYQVLLARGIVSPSASVSINTDEMLIEVDEKELQTVYEQVANIIKQAQEISDIKDILNLQSFKLLKLSSYYSYFVKQMLAPTTASRMQQVDDVFKMIPPEHFAVFFKSYYGLPVVEKDLKIAWNIKNKVFDCIFPEKLGIVPVIST